MNKIVLLLFVSLCIAGSYSKSLGDVEVSSTAGSTYTPYNEEIVVESSLNIVKKGSQLVRQKRQFGGGGFGGFRNRQGPKLGFGGQFPQFPQSPFQSQQYGQSSALANANANNHYSGPGGFGASQAGAGAQSFQAQGPLGGFGASASNAQSQGFHAGPGGIQGNAGFSGGQSYNLPGGKNVALTYGAGYNVGPDGRPSVSNSNSLAYTK